MKGKKDIYILILSHGKLAEEFYNTAKMIIGDIKDVYFFSISRNMSFANLEKKVKNFFTENKKKDIIIFTDLFGGSCLNVCSSYINRKNVEIFSGVNLGILLEAIFLRNSQSLDQLAKSLDDKKDSTMVYVNKEICK